MRIVRTVVAIVALFCMARMAQAEAWISLEQYVDRCVVIVKAKAVAESENRREYEITEVWVGSRDLIRLNDQGRYVAYKGEHGTNVVTDQALIFFFTRDNQPEKGKLTRHSTAFPIEDERLVYGVTSDDDAIHHEYTVDEFKAKVLEIVARAKSDSDH